MIKMHRKLVLTDKRREKEIINNTKVVIVFHVDLWEIALEISELQKLLFVFCLSLSFHGNMKQVLLCNINFV